MPSRKKSGPWQIRYRQMSAKGRLTRPQVIDQDGQPVKLSTPRAAHTAALGSQLLALLPQIESDTTMMALMLKAELPCYRPPTWLADLARLLAEARRQRLI